MVADQQVKPHRTIALFDVDGTLTAPRKVCTAAQVWRPLLRCISQLQRHIVGSRPSYFDVHPGVARGLPYVPSPSAWARNRVA